MSARTRGLVAAEDLDSSAEDVLGALDVDLNEANLEPTFGDHLVERHARHRHRLLAFAARLWCLSNPLHGRLEQRRRVPGHVERHGPGAVGHGRAEDLDVPEAPRRGDDLAVLGLSGFERDDLQAQLVAQDGLSRERYSATSKEYTMLLLNTRGDAAPALSIQSSRMAPTCVTTCKSARSYVYIDE